MEVYLKGITEKSLLEWLSSVFESIDGPFDGGAATVYHIKWNGSVIPVILTPNIESQDFTSLWFNSENLPWCDTKEIAHQLSEVFETKVRYEMSGEFLEYYQGQSSITEEWS